MASMFEPAPKKKPAPVSWDPRSFFTNANRGFRAPTPMLAPRGANSSSGFFTPLSTPPAMASASKASASMASASKASASRASASKASANGARSPNTKRPTIVVGGKRKKRTTRKNKK